MEATMAKDAVKQAETGSEDKNEEKVDESAKVEDSTVSEEVVDDNETSNADETEEDKVEFEVDKPYTKDEFDELVKSAVNKGVEAKIKSRIDREILKTKTVESSLTAATQELEELRESNESLSGNLQKIEKESMLYKLADESNMEISVLKSLKGDTEEELRASVAAVQKAVGDKKSNSYSKLFDGKDYTKPPAEKSFVEGIFN